MNQYNFDNLTWHDLEILCRDLLQKELSVTLENFRAGRDAGVDLRYSKPNENSSLVIQVKHYFRSGFAKLYDQLKNNELEKVKRINPKRYILCTSVNCSKTEKEKLLKLFSGYILSTNDIFDSNSLNNLLTKFSEVEKAHYKLWMTSTNVLETILEKSTYVNSKFLKEEIIEEMKLFVETKAFHEGIKKLRELNYIVIKGEPGIGKTFLAKSIIYHIMSQEAELIDVIQDNINEAYKFIKVGDMEQIFYIDDFLGSNYLDIKNSNYDSDIIKFIERVTKNKNCFVILTSRTNILNEAKFKIVRLEEKQFAYSEHEINISDYDLMSRANILYNHLFFKLKDARLFDEIIDNKFYKDIIEHDNFNPRLIEHITDSSKLTDIEPREYLEYIRDMLDDPKVIWKAPFQNCDETSKYLLYTLFSFPNVEIKEDILKEALRYRLEYEKTHSNLSIPIDYYNSSLKKLLGSFLVRKEVQNYFSSLEEFTIEFFNPSMKDFLINHISKDEESIISIIESSIYFEQIHELVVNQEQQITDKIFDAISSKLEKFDDIQSIKSNREVNISCIKLLIELNGKKSSKTLATDLLYRIASSINWDYNGRDQIQEIEYIISKLADIEIFQDFFKNILPEVIGYIITRTNYLLDIEEECDRVLKYFEITFETFIENNRENNNITEALETCTECSVEDLISEYTQGNHSVDEAHDNLSSSATEFYELLEGLDMDLDIDRLIQPLECDYTEKIEENLPPEDYDPDFDHRSSSPQSSSGQSYAAYSSQIDNLFSAR